MKLIISTKTGEEKRLPLTASETAQAALDAPRGLEKEQSAAASAAHRALRRQVLDSIADAEIAARGLK
jgi:hypothetical protein